MKPIKSQEEANKSREYLAVHVARVQNVSIEQAISRIDAFMSVQGQILKQFGVNENDEWYRILCDTAMTIPQLYEDKLKYWETRCKLAEKCLDESPCDPDITLDQSQAHKIYNDFLNDNRTTI